MARNLHELVAPFRRVMKTLDAASAWVRRSGDDDGFWALSRAFDEVPSCVAFQPFCVTAGWTVDLAKSDDAAGLAPSRREWEELVKQAASRRADTHSSRTPGSVAATAPAGGSAEARRPVGVSSAQAPRAAAERLREHCGKDFGTTLVRLLELVDDIERTTQMRGAPAQSDLANRGTHDERRRAEASLKSAFIAGERVTAREARRSDGPRLRPMPSSSLVEGEPQQRRSSGLALLAELVAAIGDRRPSLALGPVERSDGQRSLRADPVPRVPAPRAVSLLVPRPAASTSRGSLPSARRDAEGHDIGGERGSTDPTTGADSGETLTERLNQALIEQAWLRGVDLT